MSGDGNAREAAEAASRACLGFFLLWSSPLDFGVLSGDIAHLAIVDDRKPAVYSLPGTRKQVAQMDDGADRCAVDVDVGDEPFCAAATGNKKLAGRVALLLSLASAKLITRCCLARVMAT